MTTQQTRRPRPGRIAAVVGGVVVLLLATAYAVGYLMAKDNLPKNASVANIPIGGMTAQEATAKLSGEYADEAAQPLQVSAAGQRFELKPSDIGLSVDYRVTVERAGAGRSLNPLHIWRVLTGGGPIDPVVHADDQALTRAADDVAAKVDRPAKDASISYAGVEVKRTEAQNAVTLDRADFVEQTKASYLRPGEITVQAKSTEPAVTTAEADQTVAKFAKPAVSGPIKVDTGQGVFEVAPENIAAAATFVPKDGGLEGLVDGAKLWESSQPALKKLNLKRAKDAAYRVEGGQTSVVPAESGWELTPDDFVKAVVPAVPAREHRDVKVALIEAKPKFTTEAAQQQLPKQVIGEFTTYYPHADYRNTNLGLAASRINGHTVPKGEVFSLDDALGSRSSGYVEGWVIDGGKLKQENAGGISQSATTTFNAAWFAGLEDIEHQPHTMYFDRYPAGRESTIYSGSIDVKFRNDTDNAIYLEASNAPSSPGGKGSITVRIWGTKKWDIESPEPTKSDFYDGTTITDPAPQCHAQAASPGFTASYYRLFKSNGAVVKREDRTWKYAATDEIKCPNAR